VGRKRLDENLRKEMFTVRIPKWMIEEMKRFKGYNSIVEELIRNYLKTRDK
jgi:hypothetical protein